MHVDTANKPAARQDVDGTGFEPGLDKGCRFPTTMQQLEASNPQGRLGFDGALRRLVDDMGRNAITRSSDAMVMMIGTALTSSTRHVAESTLVFFIAVKSSKLSSWPGGSARDRLPTDRHLPAARTFSESRLPDFAAFEPVLNRARYTSRKDRHKPTNRRPTVARSGYSHSDLPRNETHSRNPNSPRH
jgi:hypothetical protein